MDDSFVATQNVSHFRELLSRERQPDRGSKLLDLLGAELAKLPEPARRLELIKTARYLIERSRLSYPIDAGQMTPTEMRDKADACNRLAETLRQQVDRHSMHQAAGQWREMARQIEAIQEDLRRIRRT